MHTQQTRPQRNLLWFDCLFFISPFDCLFYLECDLAWVSALRSKTFAWYFCMTTTRDTIHSSISSQHVCRCNNNSVSSVFGEIRKKYIYLYSDAIWYILFFISFVWIYINLLPHYVTWMNVLQWRTMSSSGKNIYTFICKPKTNTYIYIYSRRFVFQVQLVLIWFLFCISKQDV